MTRGQRTFAELGIPSPLFEAAAGESDYVGPADCSVCSAGGVHCFELGIGADVVVACPACGADHGRRRP